MHGAPAARPSNPFPALLSYFISGPSTIRKTLAEQGPTQASFSACALSWAWFTILILGSIVISGCIMAIAVAGLWPSNQTLGDLRLSDLLAVVLMVPLGLVIILMLLSALAAVGLALVAIFKRGEEKSQALLAFLLSVFTLIWHSCLVIFSLAYSGVVD